MAEAGNLKVVNRDLSRARRVDPFPARSHTEVWLIPANRLKDFIGGNDWEEKARKIVPMITCISIMTNFLMHVRW